MSFSDATDPVRAGSVLGGRYQLVRVVAQGGMATVWEGHDKVLARSVAVKVLHAHLANDRLFLERFRREAVSAARLAHPNVVATFDAGVADDGTAFIVMELIRGRTLSAFSAQHRPLPVFVVVAIAMQITEALTHAHSAGLVHRDIKPANVLVCDSPNEGMPLIKVTDFGIAKAAEGLGIELTKTGMVLGTPKYLSPEQIDGRGEPDARADLYALGVVVFELLTGDTPFHGPTELAIAMQHLNTAPPRVRELRPGVSPALDGLVAGLLAKRPEDRPPSASAVRQALTAADPTEAHGPAGAPGRPGNDETGRVPAAGPEPAGGPRGPGGRSDPGNRTRPGGSAGPGGGSLSGPPSQPSGPVPPTRMGALPGPGGGTASLGRATPSTRVDRPPAQPSVGAGGAQRPGTAGGPPPAQGRRPARKPNWAGRLVAGLVVSALVVVAVVLAGRRAGSNRGSPSPGPSVASTPIVIGNVSVFHLERDADDAAAVRNAIDGNPGTLWHTDTYFTPQWGNLRHGLGLAATLDSSHKVHTLTVASPTVGWSAEVYVAASVPDPPALAPWGPPVDSKQAIEGSVTFNLGGRTGGAVLLWITDLGPARQAAVAELTVR